MAVLHGGRQVLRIAMVLCVSGLLGCRSERPSSRPKHSDAGLGLPTQHQAEVGVGAAVDTGQETAVVITPERLQKFIDGQKEALVEARKAATGKAATDKRGRLEALAAAEAEVYPKHGLPPDEARMIGQLVGDVLARRAIGRATDATAVAENLNALKQKLGEETQGRLEPLMKELEAEGEKSKGLADERARYGEVSVSNVLAREAELTELWEARTALLLGRGGP